jgi:rubredoxin
MSKYVCNTCGYVYDPVNGAPEKGIPFGTGFKDLPDDWLCSGCGSPKSNFEAALSSETKIQTPNWRHTGLWKEIIARLAPEGK